jgi:flagellar basal-body rod protein FlgB
MRMDGNNVDIDVEMSELAKNTIYYDALRLKASKEFQRLKMVISEGRR